MKWLLLLILLIPLPAQAGWLDDWDAGDRLLLAGYTATWAIDLGQTREIAVNDDYTEGNAWLGKHPDRDTVEVYFVGMYLINTFVANTLTGWWRKAWLGLWIVEHGRCIVGNQRAGITLNFSF